MDREFPGARPVTATPCRGVRSVYKNLGAALKFNLGDRLSTQGGYYLPANFCGALSNSILQWLGTEMELFPS